MEFKQTSFEIIKWEYDPDIIALVKNLEGTGAHIGGRGVPEYQPDLTWGKNKRMPVAWLTLEWRDKIIGKSGNEILAFEAHDTRQFNPFSYTYDDIRATVARSFDSMLQQYVVLHQQIGIQPDILAPSRDEFESWCRDIEQFLKGKIG